jgi:ATP-dependent DNA helicase RecG
MDRELRTLSVSESKHIEIKERYTKTLLKTVSAFANFHDGRIIIGITDKGNVVGIEDSKQLRLNIEQAINDSVNPRPYYEIEIATYNNLEVLVIKVFKGDHTPYVYDRKAYQRLDTSTIEVDKIQYDELVLLGKNLTYEELVYGSLDLKFGMLEKHLKDSLDIREVDENILKSIELYKNDSYNNAAALLADKNKYNEIGLDLICYQDNSMLEIKDRVQVSGVSIIEHYEKSMAFYYKHINKRDIIKSEKRITYEEIPLVAYREAIANAIIHRDYSKRGHSRIEFFEDRVEMVSIGGLPIGISEEEFINGNFTHPRNRIIMDIFLRIKLIEKLGTGIRRIKSVYAVYNEKPLFEVMKNSIKITLPKIESIRSQKSQNMNSILLNIEEDKVLNYIKSCGVVTRTDIEKYMGVKKTKATILLNELLKNKFIIKIGSGRSMKYSINGKL